MIQIQVKDNESVDRALKRFKKKFERTGTMKSLRSRQHYVKPSVRNREQMKKAIYKNQLQLEE